MEAVPWVRGECSGSGVLRLQARHSLRIGTDCSGAEAPIWALRAMGIAHTHVFSCDCDKDVQTLIHACSPPEVFFEDMLRRPTTKVPDVHVYVCGFPCTPYSSLRQHSTKLFKDPNARPYFAMLKVLRAKLPALGVLENVAGLKRVMNKVLRDLESLGHYHILWMSIDSQKLGEPVARPRFYFLLLRRDACISSDTQEMAAFCRACLKATHRNPQVHIKSRMLPASADEVSRFLDSSRRRPVLCSGVPRKWQAKHQEFCARVLGSSATPSAASQSLALPCRQRELLAMLEKATGTTDLIVDVSQNIERAHPHTDGVCPTITPRGIFYVGALGRTLVPCEKMLLQGFPLHRMRVPRKISDSALGKMGGNTMHLHAVGLALLMGIRLLRDPVPAVSPAVPLVKSKAVFVSI